MTQRTTTEQENFWQKHFASIHLADDGRPLPWLDLSNERVQAQHIGLALEAVGPVSGCHCLDVGCGWGQMTLCLHALGGNVTGIDIVADRISELQRTNPHIRWIAGSLLDPSVFNSLGYFDIILALEVLQYVDLRHALDLLWSRLNSNGRIVGIIPNAHCPIVQRVMSRFEGNFCAVTGQTLADVLDHLPSTNEWAMKGLIFRSDQQLWPYQTTRWTNAWDWPTEPNRLMFIAQKK